MVNFPQKTWDTFATIGHLKEHLLQIIYDLVELLRPGPKPLRGLGLTLKSWRTPTSLPSFH